MRTSNSSEFKSVLLLFYVQFNQTIPQIQEIQVSGYHWTQCHKIRWLIVTCNSYDQFQCFEHLTDVVYKTTYTRLAASNEMSCVIRKWISVSRLLISDSLFVIFGVDTNVLFLLLATTSISDHTYTNSLLFKESSGVR